MVTLGFEGRITESGQRYLVPVLLVAAARTAIAFTLSLTLWKQGFGITRIFFAHDSGYYLDIAKSWYPPYLAPAWHVFPFYPSTIRVAYLLGFDVSASAAVIAVSCGLISVPIFQIIVEHYFSRGYAMIATLLYFLLPPVFVFSGVAYSESLFLLFTLLAWYCHLRGHEERSLIAVVLSSLARANGVLIIIPLAYGYLKRRQFRRLFFLTIPLLFVFGWLIYGYLMTGGWAYFASNIFWQSGNITVFRQSLINVLQGKMYAIGFIAAIGFKYLPITIGAVISLVVFIIICYKVLKIDRALGIFSFGYLAALLLFGFPATFGSFPRFLGVLFPIGLTLYTGRAWLLILIIIGLLVLDYFAWVAFLTDGFI
ncbi:MAG TPA: hypothetical protein VE862_02450 [Candidatus Acidoferrum sp.]|nr:hypothetical protein [Candidatus Acidoferrum sp.]